MSVSVAVARSSVHLVSYTRDSVIYSEGQEAKEWFRVVSGVVRTCKYFANGNRQVTALFLPDQVFGVEKASYRATAEAVTDVVVARQDRRNLTFQDSRWFDPSERRPDPLDLALEDAESRVEILGARGATARMAAFLLDMAARAKDEDHCAELPMPRADIADYLAIDVATVSRTLSQFVRQGLVSIHGRQRYRIRDPARLRDLAVGHREGAPEPKPRRERAAHQPVYAGPRLVPTPSQAPGRPVGCP